MGGTCCISRNEEQVGKSILWLPWFFVNAFVSSVESAEKKLGKPASTIEIFVELNENHRMIPVKNIW
jgi:hypothetical protein